MDDRSERRRAVRDGMRDVLPILPGVAPFGMIYGAAAVATGLSPWLAQAMSAAIFAGASQVALVDLLARGAGWLTILTAVLVINSRFMMYGASLAQVMTPPRGPLGALAAYILTDQGYAVTLVRGRRDRSAPHQVAYYFGGSVCLWSTWQLGTAGGVLLGALVPPTWQLEFTIPLMFLALLAPVLADRPSWLAAVVSGAGMILGRGLPHNLGLIVGVAAGIAAGLAAERRYGRGEGA